MKINVGCGKYPHPDYLNVDNDIAVGQFVTCLGFEFKLANAHQLPVGDGTADVVYASHILEHYLPTQAKANGHATVDTLLAEWNRVLKVGGELFVAVPDILECCSRVISEPRRREDWLGMVYAYHKMDSDTHMWGYTPGSLAKLLARHGFAAKDMFKPFIENPAGDGFDCAGAHCLDDEGNECPVSLNLVAEKVACSV